MKDSSTCVRTIRVICRCLTLLLGAVVIASGLLIAVGIICSSERMRDNLQKDIPYFLQQGDLNYILGEEYLSFSGDFPSDVLMVKTCIYDNGDQQFLKRVFGDYHYLFEGYETDSDKNILLDLNRGWLDEGVEIPSYIYHYGRYWHGYQVILKPLLCVFSWREILIIGLFAQLVTFSVAVMLIYKNHGAIWVVPIACLYFLLNPVTIAMSFQYQSLFYITFGGLIGIESKFGKKYMGTSAYIYFMLLLGILTSFFDFLTYPIVPVGVCLCWIIAISNGTMLENVKKLFFGGLAWGTGYGLFWASKWLITTLVTSENILSNAGKSFTGYISNKGTSLWKVITDNYSVLLKKPYIAILLIVALLLLVWNIKHFGSLSKYRICLPVLAISLLPLVWYIFASHHSDMHSYMTHRDSALTYYAVFVYLLATSKNDMDVERINEGSMGISGN